MLPSIYLKTGLILGYSRFLTVLALKKIKTKYFPITGPVKKLKLTFFWVNGETLELYVQNLSLCPTYESYLIYNYIVCNLYIPCEASLMSVSVQTAMWNNTEIIVSAPQGYYTFTVANNHLPRFVKKGWTLLIHSIGMQNTIIKTVTW